METSTAQLAPALAARDPRPDEASSAAIALILGVCVTLLFSGCTPEAGPAVSPELSLSERAERVVERSLDVKAGERLVAEVGSGALGVRASAEEPPGLKCRIEGHGRTLEEAGRVVEAARIEVVREGDTVKVRPVAEPLVIEQGGTKAEVKPTTDLEIVVPLGVRLEGRTGSGEVKAAGAFASVDLEGRFGAVTVAGARGDVRAQAGSGDVSVSDIAGGSVEVGTDFGKVTLSGVSASELHASSKSGDLSGERLEARAMDLRSGFGAIRLRGARGALVARSESGELDLEGLDGSIDVYSGFGSVNAQGVLQGLEARSRSGDLRVRALQGSRVGSEWVLEARFGKIELGLAGGVACEVDARTRFGSVRSDFPVEVTADSINSSSARGVIGDGGGKASLQAQSGDIELKRL